MEKDLKDKKQEEKNTPKIPWTKLVPAAAVIAALVFSGIKAKGSDGETEAVGQAETTVMSASELEKYLGYEKENTVSDSTTATAEKNSTTKKKSSSKKSSKKSKKGIDKPDGLCYTITCRREQHKRDCRAAKRVKRAGHDP